jgi:hypothetical protein
VTAVRVIIPTTEGVAEVQRLTEEAPEIRSVVCLDGTATALAISPDYEAFVRQPTGVIERLWRHPAFRLDVSARIEQGRSWQLGVLLAHALHEAGRLAGRGAPAGLVVWATGEVDADLAVRPVEAVPRKLAQSAALFATLAAAGTKLLILLPAGVAVPAAALPAGCELRQVAAVAEAVAALGLPALPARQAGRAAPALRRRRRSWAWPAAVLGVLALLAVPAGLAAGWRDTLQQWRGLAASGQLIALDDALQAAAAGPHCLGCAGVAALARHWLIPPAPDPATLLLTAEAVHGSRFGGCEAASEANLAPVMAAGDAALATSSAATSCLVRYRASGAPYVALLLLSGRKAALADGPQRAELQLPVPRWLGEKLDIRIVLLGAAVPLHGSAAWLLQALQAQEGPAAPEAPLQRLAALGVAHRVVRHQIVPAGP